MTITSEAIPLYSIVSATLLANINNSLAMPYQLKPSTLQYRRNKEKYNNLSYCYDPQISLTSSPNICRRYRLFMSKSDGHRRISSDAQGILFAVFSTLLLLQLAFVSYVFFNHWLQVLFPMFRKNFFYFF